MAKNHPNDYVYFNELVGGLHGAYGDYETDYYYNALKKGDGWFKKNVVINDIRSGSDAIIALTWNIISGRIRT